MMLCPICGLQGEPGPVGENGPRESLVCPGCGASSRWRAVGAALLREIVPDGQKGIVRSLVQLSRANVLGHYRAYEISQGMPFKMRALFPWYTLSELANLGGVLAECQNVERLTYEDESFDLIFCCDVLEHVRLYVKALREMARVLAYNGLVFITAPGRMGDRHEECCVVRDASTPAMDLWLDGEPKPHHGQDGECRVYRQYGYTTLLQQMAQAGLAGDILRADIPENGVVDSTVIVGRRRA